jgi:hypothetical protein
LQRFTFHDMIGRTALGEVYLVTVKQEDGRQEKRAAHILPPPKAGIDNVALQLRTTCGNLARLGHPNILSVQELALVKNRLVLLREHHDGGQLSDCVSSRKRLAPGAVAGIMCKVAEALDAAWNTADASGRPLQIAHQNVAPEHILLTDEGKVKLIDFGIANILGVKGTTNHTQDMFGLANALFVMWTGETFMKGLVPAEKSKLLNDAPRYATFIEDRLRLVAGVGEEGKELQRTLLSLNPDNRPSVKETAEILQSIYEQRPVKLKGIAEGIPRETRITKIRGKTLTEEEWDQAGPVWETIPTEEEEKKKPDKKPDHKPDHKPDTPSQTPVAETKAEIEYREMSNQQIANVVVEMADLMELSGTEEREVWSVRNHAHDIEEVSDKLYVLAKSGRLDHHKDLSATALRMAKEILATGTTADLEDLKTEVPSGLRELKAIGLSPRTVGLLHKTLQVGSLLDLETVVETGELEQSRLGRHTKQEILKVIQERRSPSRRDGMGQKTLIMAAVAGVLLLGAGAIVVWMMTG